MFGFKDLADFVHDIENALQAVRQGTLSFSKELLDACLAAHDHIPHLTNRSDSESQQPDSPGNKDGLDPITKKLIVRFSKLQEAGPHSKGVETITDTKPLNDPPDKTRKDLSCLIVEDDFISRCLLQEFLRNYGKCHVAVDGYEAVLAFRLGLTEKRNYDLVCLDIMMPGMDGGQVAREIKRLEKEYGPHQKAKILVTTAAEKSEIVSRMKQEDLYDAMLGKPLDFARLSSLIRELFTNS